MEDWIREMSDEALFHLVVAGEVDAFDELLRRYGDAVLVYLVMLGFPAPEARRITDRMFASIGRNAHKIRTQWGRTFKEMLFRRAWVAARHNAVWDLEKCPGYGDWTAEGETAIALSREEQLQLEIQRDLPLLWRESIHLHKVEGFTCEQTARIMGASAGEIFCWVEAGLVQIASVMSSYTEEAEHA